MAGPWEKYAQPAGGKPWERYATPTVAASKTDRQTGQGESWVPGQEAKRQQTVDPTSIPTFGGIEAYDPSVAEQVGNRLYDAARSVGLPASRMRRDAQSLDAGVRGAADTASFGFADEIAAGMGSMTGIGGQSGEYEKNLELQRAVDERDGQVNPGVRLLGQVGGGFALPAKMAASVPKAIGQGAAGGYAYGLGSSEGSVADRAVSAVPYGLTGGVVGGAVRGVANTLGNRAAASVIPSNEQLKKAAQAAFNKADFAGVVIKPEGMKRLGATISDDLAEFGYDEALQPGIAATLRRLDQAGSGNITLKGLDIVRRVAANAGKDPMNPSQQALSAKIIGRIDDYLDDLPAEDVLMGNTKEGTKALSEARGLWAQLRKSEMVDTATLKAERRAASTGSGGNADNALRQNVRGLLDNAKTARGMSAAEKAAAERVVRGSAGQNAMRLVGKMAPTGIVSGGIGTTLGASVGSIAGPAGAAVGSIALPAVGAAAKKLADRSTVKAAERLSQVIRSGGQTASDLGKLARSGQLDVRGVTRVENVAKSLGVSVPELAAMLQERVREAF